jgi:hypothetical protein
MQKCKLKRFQVIIECLTVIALIFIAVQLTIYSTEKSKSIGQSLIVQIDNDAKKFAEGHLLDNKLINGGFASIQLYPDFYNEFCSVRTGVLEKDSTEGEVLSKIFDYIMWFNWELIGIDEKYYYFRRLEK